MTLYVYEWKYKFLVCYLNPVAFIQLSAKSAALTTEISFSY